MKDVTITCDTCGLDLKTTSNTVDYRLLVTSETIPSWGGAVTLMMKYPPVDRPYHFCGLKCLQAHPIATGTPAEDVS